MKKKGITRLIAMMTVIVILLTMMVSCSSVQSIIEKLGLEVSFDIFNDQNNQDTQGGNNQDTQGGNNLGCISHNESDAVIKNNIQPTCTTAGSYDYVIYCSTCGDELSRKTVTVDPIGHNYIYGYCEHCGAKDPAPITAEVYVRCDKDETPNENGEYILFGEYPQTIKADDVTITSTIDSRGYYLGSDGSYYAAVTAAPYKTSYIFTNNATIVSGIVYYFKVEPIRWRILSEENGEAFILCDSIIANMAYQSDCIGVDANYTSYTTANGAPEGTYANNYKYSEVRKWLNDNFYNTAFSEIEKEIILTTEVDNSAKSANPYGNKTEFNDGVNIYACENTYDKIFLLSEEEATNSAYGFGYYSSQDTARSMQTSDYSRATGVWMNTDEPYFGNGWWWLRSPCYYHSRLAHGVYSHGYANSYDDVSISWESVVPALRISL